MNKKSYNYLEIIHTDSISFQIFIVLSHSAVIILVELLSNLMSNIDASLDNDPGYTGLFNL